MIPVVMIPEVMTPEVMRAVMMPGSSVQNESFVPVTLIEPLSSCSPCEDDSKANLTQTFQASYPTVTNIKERQRSSK